MKNGNVFPLASLFVILIVTLSIAQAPDTLWTRTYGGTGQEVANSVQQTTDGGYILAGSTASFGAGFDDFYLVKTNSLGDTLWTRTMGGFHSETAYSVQQTYDGGYIIAGYTNSFGAGQHDFYLVKTHYDGDVRWTNIYGGTGYDQAYSVQQTSDRGYIAAGNTQSFGAGTRDFYLVKTNVDGDTLWTRTYGGTDHDRAYSVQQTEDGGYIIAGYTRSFGAGGYDFYVVKTDSAGDTLWTRTYGGAGYDVANSVQQTSDGGYVIAGRTRPLNASNYDFYLVKTDSLGDTQWTRTYGEDGNDKANSVQQTSDGGYILVGETDSFGIPYNNIYVVKTNSRGDTLWARMFGGGMMDIAYSVQQTSDGGYIIAGLSDSFVSGFSDCYLIKTDADGTPDVPSGGDVLIPKDFIIYPPYPNPFNPTTTISYQMPVRGLIKLDVYNVLGLNVATMIADVEAGSHHMVWDAKDLPSGIYFCRMQAGDFQQVRKVVLLK